METIEKIKAEIDRQIEELGMSGSVCVGRSVLLEIRDFVNSLEKELDLTTTEEVTLGAIARHLIAIKDHIEDARLDDEELEVLRKIGYPERYGIQAIPKIKGWVARDRNNALDDINTLIKAIAIVLIKKTILIDSFNITETPDLSVKGTVTVTSQRVFSLTFTEILRPSEFKAMMNGEGLPTVFEQIQKEYNHLLSNHEDNR